MMTSKASGARTRVRTARPAPHDAQFGAAPRPHRARRLLARRSGGAPRRAAEGRRAARCRAIARLVGRLRPSGSIARRNCATSAQAARHYPGEVAARRRSGIMRRNIGRHPRVVLAPIMAARRPPPRAHPHPRAGGRRRRSGIMRRNIGRHPRVVLAPIMAARCPPPRAHPLGGRGD